MKKKGLFFVWTSILITINLFALAKIYSGLGLSLTWTTASQLASLLGTNLLCISYILSGRFKLLDYLFGGLDKVYRIHHTTGGLAFVMLLHHPLFLIVNALPNTELTSKYFWFSDILAYNFGVMALYLMILLLLLTLVINLPYHIWLKTHEYMGLVLLLASAHILTITSDVSRFAPLKLWLVTLLILGVFSAAYKKFFYKYFGPKFTYEVDDISIISDTYTIYLKPSSVAMSYYPGQYVFASFEKLGPESHPYSIASTGADGKLRLSIKVLGDYTLNLKKLAVGDKAVLFGPYGSFYESLLGSRDLVFVAGGIGITPFLGMLEMANNTNKQKIDLIYCTKNESEMIFSHEIEKIVNISKKITLHKFCSDDKGRISPKEILRLIGGGDKKKFLLCGPQQMMENIAIGLASLGVKKRNVIFEDFSFK